MGALLRKLRDRQIQVHQRIENPEGHWIMTVSFYSDCSHKFRSEYSHSLPGGPEIDRLILPAPNTQSATAQSATTNTPGPYRSDVFLNKVITDYSLVPSNGTDDFSDVTPPTQRK
jgi:hypothetical protein